MCTHTLRAHTHSGYNDKRLKKADLVNIEKTEKHELSPVGKGTFSCFAFFLHAPRPSVFWLCVLGLSHQEVTVKKVGLLFTSPLPIEELFHCKPSLVGPIIF